jgi:fumarate hydratase subunit alpha
MREIKYQEIVNTVARLCIEANCIIGDDIVKAFKKSLEIEESPTAKEILRQLIENTEIAKAEMIPACQDTGTAVIFVELGSEVKITGGELIDAINEGVKKGYTEGYLRKSIVADPLRRKNTGDNTPAVIHIEIVPGNKLKITVAPKGGGSENMSEVRMLTPAHGWEGIKNFVIDRVMRSKANPCPPILVGVGIGGNFEKVAYLAKKALLREVGSIHSDPFYAEKEKELLEAINKTGIGPQGLGGRVTALGVFIETYPCHIASMPVAVNINCHAARHKTAII